MAQSISQALSPSRAGLIGRLLGLAGDGAPSVPRPSLATTGRILLIGGCALAIGIVAGVAEPSAYLQADPGLARLLRGMALIKGAIAIGAVSAVFWRMAWPISGPVAALYVIGAWLLAGSTMMIWQLSSIGLAALLFHVAAAAMLLVAWRER
jgi:hypothetical protein